MLDPITEQIAHFIGHFSIKLEEARLREQYDLFRALKAQAEELTDLITANVRFAAPYELIDVEPYLKYTPGSDEIVMKKVDTGLVYDRFPFTPDEQHLARPTWTSDRQFTGDFQNQIFAKLVIHPGSIAIVTWQQNLLEDNDFVGTDMADVSMQLDAIRTAVDALTARAEGLSLVGDLTEPESEQAIAELIKEIYDTVSTVEDIHLSSGDEYQIVTRDTSKPLVNGEKVAFPELKNFINRSEPDEETTPPPKKYEAGEGEVKLELKTEISAGGNLLVNEALIVSQWTVSPVCAVVKDYVSIDLISQINIWADQDDIGGILNSASQGLSAKTLAFNLASISRTPDHAKNAKDDAPNKPLKFPDSWSVTRIEGNLVLLNWTEQINAVHDNDFVNLLSKSGRTSLITGENTAINSKSLLELGNYYDLIIIGGSVFSGNVIEQINVLLDSDSMAGGKFKTSGKGSHQAGDNLLWNEAKIEHIGSSHFEALPQHYRDAALRLATGDESVSQAILNDPAFAGIGHLRVLYIKQDLIKFNYVKQTNILSDADQIQLPNGNLADLSDPKWDITSGKNDLLNLAKIVDAGADAKIKVGGKVYSDELLHQAELVSDTAPLGSSSNVPIVTEAVVFLADDMLSTPGDNDHGVPAVTVSDSVSVDVMQTMLG